MYADTRGLLWKLVFLKLYSVVFLLTYFFSFVFALGSVEVIAYPYLETKITVAIGGTVTDV